MGRNYQQTSGGGTGTILVVDDDAMAKELAVYFLQSHGYRVLGVNTELAAWHVLTDEDIDLILLSPKTARMDGVSFLRRLRGQAAHALTPVIVLAEAKDRSRVLEIARYGVRDYLVNSQCDLPTLLGRIQQRLGQPGANASGGVSLPQHRREPSMAV